MVYFPVLTGKGFSLKLKIEIYAGCIRRSCLTYGGDTRPVKVEHEVNLDRNEMSVLRWKDNKKNMGIGKLLGLDLVSLSVERSKLRWFGHVECKDDADWLK